MRNRTTRAIVITACFVLGAAYYFTFAALAQTDFPDGSLWRAGGDFRVYVISGSMKRHVPNPEVFRSYGFRDADVKEADSETLMEIPDVRVIRTASDPAVYDIRTGARRLIGSPEEFLDNEFSWNEISIVNETELESYAIAVEPPRSVKDGATYSAAHVSQPLLLQKISEARELLKKAPLLYPQEKRITFSGSMKKGDSGPRVKLLQEKLKELGYFPTSVTANGNFGPTTDAAVRSFQRAKRISAIGIVGPQTQAALAQHGLSFGTRTVTTWQDTVPEDREILLAAWHRATDNMQTVRILLKSERVKVGTAYRTVLHAVSKTAGFSVSRTGGSGVNIQYAITSPPDWQVLANRFPIFDESSNKIGTFPPDEEVYVPYSDALRTAEIVASGRAYLDTAVNKALAELRKNGVQSASGNGLLADRIDPDEMKNIAIIEHIDHADFLKADDKHGIINKVLVTLAANRENAYRFSGSSKGALGLAQFIQSTYNGTVKQFPEAKLIPEFEWGMADHVNAFKAMALYLDVSGATLESYVRDLVAAEPEDVAFALAEVKAAAYNGGAGRVKSSLKRFGQNWDSAIGGLRAETKMYLVKYRIVRQILKTS